MAYANSTLRSLPFGRVIGGPMVAAIQAQSLAAQATVDFIKSVGFKAPAGPAVPGQDPAIGEIINVVFQFERKKTSPSGEAANDQTEKITLQVPLLTIVPIPFIRIEEMTIDFTAKITEDHTDSSSTSSSSSVSTDTSLSFSAGSFLSPVKVGLNAKVATRHNNASASSSKNRYNTEYTIDIHLRAVQDEMPAGLSKILNILENAIFEKPATA
jgi:hypothetical protein